MNASTGATEDPTDLLTDRPELDGLAAGLLGPLRSDRAARLRASARGAVIGVASLALWLCAWELASRYELELFFRFENIPAPSEVLRALGELLLLSDRVVVLSHRPGAVKAELPIGLPRPRTRDLLTSPELMALKRTAFELLLGGTA